MNFERGNINPKVTMEIGNPILRDFDRKVAQLRKDLLETLNGKDFLIKEFSYSIEETKEIISTVIRNHYGKKYGWEFYNVYPGSIGEVDVDGFTLGFKIASQFTSFAVRLSNIQNGFIMESNYATSLSKGEKEIEKVLKIIKDYNDSKMAY